MGILFQPKMSAKWAIPEKIQTGGRLKVYFSEKPPGNFRFVTLPKKIPQKKSFYSGNSRNMCDTPWKLQSQKPRRMEIPHYFFLNTPGISTFFLIEFWNFHMIFLQVGMSSLFVNLILKTLHYFHMKLLNKRISKRAHLSYKRFLRYFHLKFEKEVIFLGNFSAYEIQESGDKISNI